MIGIVFLIPPYDTLRIGQHIPVEERYPDAFFQLLFIIQKAGPGLGEKKNNGAYVG